LLGKLSRPERGELTAELRNVNKTGKLMNDWLSSLILLKWVVWTILTWSIDAETRSAYWISYVNHWKTATSKTDEDGSKISVSERYKLVVQNRSPTETNRWWAFCINSSGPVDSFTKQLNLYHTLA
jgi:hypothetical protein